MLDNDFAEKAGERIIAEAKRHGIPDVAAALLTAETIGLSLKRLTSAQAKTLAVQLIHENRTDAAPAQDSPA